MYTARHLPAIAILLSVALTSCDLNFVGDKKVGEEALREYFDSGATFVQLEAMQRVLSAIAGNTVDGVTLVPNGNNIDATVAMDFDYDGTKETVVNGGVQFPNAQMSFDDGATATIDGVTGSGVDGSVSATVTETAPGVVSVVGSGQFEGESEIPVDLDLNLTVSPLTGQVLGTVDIEADEESATAFYENNGTGGFRIRVVGEDYTFTTNY